MNEVEHARPPKMSGEVPLVFLHLHKTAGTTLEALLRHHYSESVIAVRLMRVTDAAQFRARLAGSLGGEDPRVVKGHFPFGAAEEQLPGARYLTVLREPVARTLSHYHHILRNGGRGRPETLPPLPPGVTLTEALDRGYLLDNLQTRMLCGIVSPWDELPPDALERAKRTLAGFEFVGTTERFNEFVAILNLRLGWPTVVFRIARAGRGTRLPGELEQRDLEAVEEANLLDRELHAFAGELLAEAREQVGPEVERELEVLTRALERARSRTGPRLRELTTETRVELALMESRISRARADARKVARREMQLRKRLGLGLPEPRAAKDEYPALVFVHLPKTAGTTLEALMRYLYRDSFASVRTQDALGDGELRERTAATLAERPFRAVKGHLTIGLRDLLPADARYATMLRNPIERTLSHHGHVLRGARWRPRQLPPPSPGISVVEAIEQRYIPDNLQTRMLCGIVSPWDELPADALEQAKRTLDGFEFVGTTERFDEFVALLNVELGWPTVAFKSRHVSSRRLQSEQLGAEELRAIEDANLLDAELHAYAAQLFELARGRVRPELDGELEVLTEALDRLRRKAFVPLRSLSMETRVELAIKEWKLGRARADARKHARGEAAARQNVALLPGSD